MPPIIDKGEVILVGENSFIRLNRDGGESVTEREPLARVVDACRPGSRSILLR